MEQGKGDVTDIDRLRGEGVSDMHTDVEVSSRFSRASVGPPSHARLEPSTSKAGSGRVLLTRPSSANAGLPVPGRGCVTGDLRSAERRGRETLARPTKRRTAGSEDPRGTRQIRSENSRDPRGAVKTSFAVCPSPAKGQGGPAARAGR